MQNIKLHIMLSWDTCTFDIYIMLLIVFDYTIKEYFPVYYSSDCVISNHSVLQLK